MITCRPAQTPANYLTNVGNPFGLRVPPIWWLQEMAAFDADLVLFPSQQMYCYRLCRKAWKTGGLMSALVPGSDAAVCVREHLVPVTSLGGDITFSSWIFQWLADRDTWRHGGAKEYTRKLEEQDQHVKDTERRDRDAENNARAHSMYRTYVRRAGLSVALSDVNRGRGRVARAGRRHGMSFTTFPQTHARTGSAPVPPVASTPAGWGSTAAGLVTPPTP